MSEPHRARVIARSSLPAETDRPASSVRHVAVVLGLAAAVPSLLWPSSLGFLPSPSTVLTVLATVLAFGSAGKDALRLRFGLFDAALVFLLSARLFSEFVNAVELNHAVHSGIFTTWFFLWLASISARLVIKTKRDVRDFLFWLAVPAVGVAVLAILQMLRFPGVLDWILANVSVGGLEARVQAGRTDLRSTSTIGHWTALGGYLAVAIASFCAVLIMDRSAKRRGRSVFIFICIAILFAGEMTTLTFSTVGAAAAVLLVTFLKLKGNPTLVILAGAAGIIGWQIFGSDIEGRLDQQSTVSRYTDESLRWLPSTIAYRVRIWENETVPTWLTRPLTGWGQQTYDFSPDWPIRPKLLSWASPESQWLAVLVRGGLIELFAFILLLVAMFVVIKRSRAVLGSGASPIFVVLVSLVVTFLINSPFSTNGVPQILWSIIGVLTAASTIAVGEHSESDSELDRGRA
jgi:hypothetical protein